MLVCEGVGGLLVPLTLGYLVRDFARDLGLPVVIAASPGLGTINHTLLTIEAARAVGLEVGGRAHAVAGEPRPWSARTARRSRGSARSGRGAARARPRRARVLAALELGRLSASIRARFRRGSI